MASNNKSVLREAKAWLKENPSESTSTAAKVFRLRPTSLYSSIARDTPTPHKAGGHNKVLSDAQIAVLKQWIQKQYEDGLGATREMTYAAVCYLRRPAPAPSQSWMTKFIKHQLPEYHSITTKPIAQQRTAAQDESTVAAWFEDYFEFLNTHGIQPDSIWNMDETGFRVGIPGGERVLVPIGVSELYTPSPENRTSITVIETVSAIGKVIPPVLIIEGKKHMESWYHDNLDGNERILLSDSGYSNDDLALKWLQHFILHTRSSSNSEPKVLLLDSHASHRTPEFTILATEHYIHPYAFPSHLTHVLQPLDVGIFHPYKHWHKAAVHRVIRSLDFEYNTSSFIRDLPEIRSNTFKEQTIIHAFQNSGVWPVDMNIAIQKLQKYSKPTLLPQTPTTIPQTFRDSESQLQLWKAKIPILLSSPSRPQFHDWVTGTEQVLVSGQLQEFDYSILKSRVEEQRKAKSKSRRSLQNGGALTATQAREIQAERLRKELTKTAKKAARIAKSLAIQARNQLHRAGINARKEERLRKKKVAALVRSNQPVPPELEEPIPDPEELAKQEHATETESDSNRSDDEDSIN
jgi:hypothetical protein